MTLPQPLARAVAERLGSSLTGAEAVGGGCIAHATRIAAGGAVYFLKYGQGEVARTFGPEAAGLRALRQAGSPLVVPEVRAVADETAERPGFLLLDWLESAHLADGFWKHFGEGLAALHRHTAPRYGFDAGNFIGRLPQQNGWTDTWPDFFRTRRLLPQAAMARERGRWRRDWDAPFDTLCNRLDDLLPTHPGASILHGDLWSGNFLPTASGAALVDPAAYFGHREADLAMTELFGGFDAQFYDAYRAAWPLEPGYPERRAMYNLYHVINHLNLFGEGYAGQVAATLKRFG